MFWERINKNFKELPVISNITPDMVLKNYYRIKEEIEDLIEKEIEILQNTPGKEDLLISSFNLIKSISLSDRLFLKSFLNSLKKETGKFHSLFQTILLNIRALRFFNPFLIQSNSFKKCRCRLLIVFPL